MSDIKEGDEGKPEEVTTDKVATDSVEKTEPKAEEAPPAEKAPE